MKHTFLKAGAALAMLMCSTAPVFAEETTNDASDWTEAQEGDYNTDATHSTTTNDKISGNAATTDHDGAVSSGTGEATHASDSNKSADLIYQVAEGYTWTIHSLVDFGDSKGIKNTSTVNKTNAIKVTRNVIPDGKKLSITIADNQKFTVSTPNNKSTLSYTVKHTSADTDVFKAGSEVLKVNAGNNTGATPLEFKLSTTNDTSEVAGDYKGTISYKASIVNQ